MESFYGGRQGISFVIKKRFSCIESTYNYKLYLCDNEGNIAIDNNNNLIEYNKEVHKTIANAGSKNVELNGNFPEHRKAVRFDGNAFGDIIDPSTIKINVAEEHVRGMVDCFREGGNTTNEVNYGEYVIIDTINKSDPDNGKVFRRGLDLNNEYGGGEYIGQIVGPQGKCPEVFLEDIEIVESLEGNVTSRILNFPGKYINDRQEVVYNDEVKVAFVNFIDDVNNETWCKIGFQIPYPVIEIESRTLEYNKESNIIRVDDQTHPFYYKWRLNMAEGLPGDKVETFLDEEFAKAGVDYYSDENCLIKAGTLVSDTPIAYEQYNKDLIDSVILYRPILVDNIIHYVKRNIIPEYKTILIAKYTKFSKNDVSTTGTISYKKLGSFNTIKSVTLDKNGVFRVEYTYGTEYFTQLSWVKDVSFSGNGEISIHKTDDMDNKGEVINKDNPIKWIIDSAVLDNFVVYKELTKNNNGSPIPPFGSYIVQYNTTKEKDPDTYFWNDSQIWTVIGFATNLTGIKVYQRDDSFTGISDQYNNIPDGWAILNASNDANIYYFKYTNNGVIEWHPVEISSIGDSAATTKPTENVGEVESLEEELLFGRDSITTKYIENNNTIIITEFRNEDILENYYKIKTTIYPEESLKNNLLDVQNETLIFLRGDKDAAFIADEDDYILNIKNKNIFSNSGNEIIGSEEFIVKEDILYFVYSQDMEVEKYKKVTTKQITPFGVEIIKERNYKLNA